MQQIQTLATANGGLSGIPPNPQDDWADYTVPTVRLPDGSYVMNSISIVEKLEAMYPEPSLHLETNLHEEANTASMEVVIALLPDLQVNYLRDWLQEPSLSWFAEDRERRFGMTCEELAEQKGGNTAWPAAEAGLKKLQNLLVAHKRDEGPFLMGSTVCYGDFTIAVLFESVKRVGKSDYEKIMSYDDRFKDLHEACKPWLKRDD